MRLHGRALNWRPDVYPGEAGLAALRALRAEHPARLMIWEDYLLRLTIDRLEAEGVWSLVYRPAANRPPAGDFLTVMQENLANVQRFATRLSAAPPPWSTREPNSGEILDPPAETGLPAAAAPATAP